MVGWIKKYEIYMDGWMDRKKDGWLDGLEKIYEQNMDGWMDRKKKNRQMDGWMDRKNI